MRSWFNSTWRAIAGWIGAHDSARARARLGWLFLAAVVGSVALQLHDIGWRDIWDNRPSSPLYYVLVLLWYLTLPVADASIYRRLWDVPFGSALAACLRKRIYNSALVGYSGEVFLMFWAKHRVSRTNAQLAHEVKDINILSAVVSTYVTAGLIVYLLWNGALGLAAGPAFDALAIVTLVTAVLAPVAFLFRRRFMVLPARTALGVLGTHAVRVMVVQAFLLGQWHAELPEIGVTALISLLAVQMLISRIPMIPNRDLLFVSVGIAMSGVLELPQARIASLLVTTTALQQVLHLLVILATSVKAPAPARGTPTKAAPAATPGLTE